MLVFQQSCCCTTQSSFMKASRQVISKKNFMMHNKMLNLLFLMHNKASGDYFIHTLTTGSLK